MAQSAGRDMKVALATLVVTVAATIGVVAALSAVIGDDEADGEAPIVTPAKSMALAVATATATPTPTATATRTATRTATATVTVTGTATPTLTATPAATPTPNVRRMTSAELTLLLKAQVEAQRAQFREGRVTFIPPNLVVIRGRAPVSGQEREVQAYLTMGVQDGRPRIVASRMAVGNNQPAPPEMQTALSLRVTQTNRELDTTVPAGQRVERILVTADEIIGEMDGS